MHESWTFGLLLLLISQSLGQNKCRDLNSTIKRHFYVDDHDLPITIEVSNRISHQLVSHILKIILIEKMGYTNVVLVDQDQNSTNGSNALRTLRKISNCESPRECNNTESFKPDIMVNLEVWVDPSFNMDRWVATGQIEDCGSFGPTGRSGLFIAQYAVFSLWESNGTIVDHWRAFTNPAISSMFDLTGILDKFLAKKSWTTYCTFEGCGEDGIYRPIQCRAPNSQCATIIAGFPASTHDLLAHNIQELDMLVNIVYVGGLLDKTVAQMTFQKKFVLFYNKMPSYLSTVADFTHVSLPFCEQSKDSKCENEINKLVKVAWSKIKTHAPYAFHVIQSIFFNQIDYSELLNLYKNDDSRGHNVSQVACTWVENHEYRWLTWIPDNFDNKAKLYIGGIFPLSGTYWKQSGVVIAAKMAADAINDNQTLLSDYSLTILEQDGQCAADEVMKSFINYVTSSTYKTMVGILGPACSDTVEPIAGVAKHFNTIIISYSAEGAFFDNREKYPYFFRTIPENKLLRHAYIKLLKKLDWKRVASVTESGQLYPEYLSHLQDLMQKSDMTFIENRKFPKERDTVDMKSYLQELKNKGARIIIGDFYDNAARAIMCDAYQLRMTAADGYQWFLPFWFNSDWFDTDMHRNDPNAGMEHVNCTTKQMMDAINGHMSLAYKFYADDDHIMQQGITVGKWRENYNNKAKHQNAEVSQYAGYTYDAVWVYALALEALFKDNSSLVSSLHTKKTSRRLVQLVNETDINGVSGSFSFMGSSRISDIIIWQWVNNATIRIGTYETITPEEGNLILNESQIEWFTANGKKPDDGSESIGKKEQSQKTCYLQGFSELLGVDCEKTTFIVFAIGFALFAVILIGSLVFYKRRYENKMKMTEERIKELGFLTSRGGPFALDKWEMAREHLVINRKLGEGAFGTVFGGEAMIQNGSWINVAIKTLKAGAKPEEKLDFLSEAEVMKQFDHHNIVKLVGVCTKGEPVYTIMEFMLYGDLKTYLLSRRDIAGDKERANNPEVSDRKLTSMALDIARGLSYLADLKYVHRDLACRNCLVNSSGSVKIADFGMCRAMYDSDYYRYNKKGMLPVRWMAPESLINGLFTPMSDVWSYGVVIYEIVTFASFPYQGLSNNQVLEHIKNFGTLSVPEDCNCELTSLLLKCWCRNPQSRPHAAEIVEILANQPELISPSLDMPTASVEVEGSGALEIGTHDRSRVHSLSYIWQNRKKESTVDQPSNKLIDSNLFQIGVDSDVSKPAATSAFSNRRHLFPYKTMLSRNTKKKDSKKPVVEDVTQVTYL